MSGLGRDTPPRPFRPRGSGREIPAVLLGLLWLAGFEALPLAHLAFHAELGPHSHDGEAGALHCHGSICHGDGEDAAPAGDRGPAPAPDHGEHSLAHRSLAAHTPPPGLPPLPCARLLPVRVRDEAPPAPASPDLVSVRARDPPSA
jgi:hypothetical protein